jgi:hypothetical protein
MEQRTATGAREPAAIDLASTIFVPSEDRVAGYGEVISLRDGQVRDANTEDGRRHGRRG